jgi:hypothetical protein
MFMLLAQTAAAPQLPNPSFGTDAGAQSSVWNQYVPTILPPCANTKFGCDSLSDLMQLFVNISEIILGLTGIVLLGVFVYAGFLYVTSRGESEQVTKAHRMWQGTLVGLAIIFCAYAVISYTVSVIATRNMNVPAGAYVAICDGSTETEGKACGPNAVCASGVCTSGDPSR